MRRVITVGASTIDCLMKSSSFKVVKSHEVAGGVALCEVLGGKMEAENGLITTGGGGTNVAVGLHRLGNAVKVITRLGDDDLSGLILKKLDFEHVNIDLVQHGKGNTGLSAVLVASNGSRSIITYRGESGHIIGNEINWSEMEKADWIQISSLGGNIDLLEDLVSFAAEKKIRIGLNPGKGELEHSERIIRLLPDIAFMNVNRMEASMLWKVDYHNEKEMIQKFINNGSFLVAITDGKNGASIASDRRWIKMDAFQNKSVDDTGAGDAFVSGAVAGILEDRSIEEILKMGLANGGSAVTKLGAKEGLLYKGDMEKWLSKQLKSVETELRG